MQRTLSILAWVFCALCALAQEIPESLRIFQEHKVSGHNEIVFQGEYAFVIVDETIATGISHQDKVSKQLSATMKLIQDYCLAEQLPLKSPFAETLAHTLQVRPLFRMPKLPCNVVKNETRAGHMVYVTAFQRDDLERLKETYSSMAGVFSLEEWQKCLQKYRREVQGDEENFAAFLSALKFPERILAEQSGIIVQDNSVNLQELYAALATWNPEKNSVFKSKKILQAAPGFPPAMLVLAGDEEKNGRSWKAWSMRINGQIALHKPEELEKLCNAAGQDEYGTLLGKALAISSEKVKLDRNVWKSFGHLESRVENDLEKFAGQALADKNALEAVVAANQLLRQAPDRPETIALLIEGYRQLGLESLADGACWYLVSLDKVPTAVAQQAENYLRQRFAAVLKL